MNIKVLGFVSIGLVLSTGMASAQTEVWNYVGAPMTGETVMQLTLNLGSEVILSTDPINTYGGLGTPLAPGAFQATFNAQGAVTGFEIGQPLTVSAGNGDSFSVWPTDVSFIQYSGEGQGSTDTYLSNNTAGACAGSPIRIHTTGSDYWHTIEDTRRLADDASPAPIARAFAFAQRLNVPVCLALLD